MNSSSPYNFFHGSRRTNLWLMLLVFALVFGTESLQAQTIGGMVVGGGNIGKTYSTTAVVIDTCCIVNNVFGAGNGSSATASGKSSVTIKGGTVNGNIYGGGNEAVLNGSTEVKVYGGNINHNVYGGGNKAAMYGNAQVTLQGGTYSDTSAVFAGARQADIKKDTVNNDKGKASLLLDGANVAANDTLRIPYVYGGNDISGIIQDTATVSASGNADRTLNIIVTDLFAGGNGDYDYTSSEYSALTKPNLATAVLDLRAGQYGRVFGGGNAATITGSTTIGINDSTVLADNTAYQFGQVFGGNNKAVMSIRPTWNLTAGYIDNLYSGGNAGDMTNAAGILLNLNSAGLYVNNTYGGCRMAAVDPNGDKGTGSVAAEIITEVVGGTSVTIDTFPAGYAAKVLVRAGHYNNVYGGNDVSGKVYYGTDVEIYGATISGDVYGSGNGSYAYTDKDANSDYYYKPGSSSVDSLFWHRPSVAKTRLHFWGENSSRAFIAGNTYCGGNSATIINSDGSAGTADIVIGEHVTLNQFFFGCNGENMKDTTILKEYANSTYSSLNLKYSATFARYMDGCASTYLPSITYDWTYGNTSTPDQSDVKIGSFYVGGNVGSIKTATALNLTFLKGLTIYNKVVGGCNNADVEAGSYNAAFVGGVLSTASGTTLTHKFTVDSRLEPMTMVSLTKDPRGFLTAVPTWSWNNVTYKVEGATAGTTTNLATLQGGNVYGGCYQSGSVEGNVVINIDKDLISPDITVNLDNTANYVFSKTFNVFGGGYGEKAVIKGNTEVVLSSSARVLKVYGGGEMGAVNGNTDVTTASTLRPAAGSNYNVWRIYGGSFEGPILGKAQLTLLGGKINSAVAGNCNADLAGTASVQIGSAAMIGTGYPYITNAVYGGNDFGGLISGIQDTVVNGWKVRCNSYVNYLAGKIDGKVFGGARGSYDYDTDSLSQHDATTKGGFSKPLMQTVIAAANPSDSKSVGANCFVDIASSSTSSNDKVGSGDGSGFFGGGEGKLNKKELVDVSKSFVLLHAATTQIRYAAGGGVLAPNVYGGGYYSVVDTARLEAVSGYVSTLYGGTNGATAASMADSVNYASKLTVLNLYKTMDNTALTVFGGGSYAGSDSTSVTLMGGNAKNVYGGSNKEGYCGKTLVLVPDSSNVTVDALFGGGKGFAPGLPCDVGTSTINFNSTTAYVSDGIYGGNHDYRATKITNVNINRSVRKSSGGEFTPIYGAGYGESTIAGYTHVNLNGTNNVEATKIYGGGCKGKVFGAYDDKSGAPAYYISNAYSKWNFASVTESADSTWGFCYPDNYDYNTNITIPVGATVNNVYAAGYGDSATVSGSTHVLLAGGTITEDLFGGGEKGNVVQQTSLTLTPSSDALPYQKGNVFTYLEIRGGKVRNVYGGGDEGNVGDSTLIKTSGNYAIEQTRVEIGKDSLFNTLTFADGAPTVLRSVYGGGYKGAVYATARVKMFGGYVGYYYDTSDQKYRQQLDLNNTGDNLLKESGNIYAGGYGEGATTDTTEVCMYGGTVRNSVYGGGEIASVGRASYTEQTKADRSIIPYMTFPGATHVKMYGGLVEGNVFGGGRGYAIDAYGNTQTGENSYSDGFTFGTTEVNIYRGTVGTDSTLVNGEGNVFGGGNIGYCYSYDGNINNLGQKHVTSDGYYYNSSDSSLTEDCKVLVSPYARVMTGSLTIGGKTYSKGDYVSTDSLGRLTNDSTEWACFGDIDRQGITIRNAVFAGGNVSAGSDKVYANTETVYGNATASIVDTKTKDLVTVGEDEIGGLYGDGNLTFVDGYRELNITNYGTDYYRFGKDIPYATYNKLTKREQAYFELKWKKKGDNTIITNEQYQSLTDSEKQNYDPVATCNIYAGRILNTIQRADFCGIFGSRIVLQGAQDRIPSVVDYTNYAINRVKEVSLNRKDTIGNYLGFYNVVNYLGALTSDVKMTDVRTTSSKDSQYQPDSAAQTYWEWKQGWKGTRKLNNGSSRNMVALCSGVFLELVDEKTETDTTGVKTYGPITGVVELQLMSVKTGEGGGYVYAKNQHGTPTYDPAASHVTLTAANSGAASYKQYSYTSPSSAPALASIRRLGAIINNDNSLQTSGNFVNSTARIVDDCYPKRSDLSSNGHYWYIKGDYYIYDQYISAYSSSAQAYFTTSNIPLTIDKNSQGTIELRAIEKNLFAYWNTTLDDTHKGADSTLIVNNQTYSKGDPISYYEYSLLSSSDQSYFVDTVYFCSEKVGNYEAGKVLTSAEYRSVFTGSTTTDCYVCTSAYTSLTGTAYTLGQVVSDSTYAAEVFRSTNYRQNFLPITECVAIANSVTHDNGFTLTLDWNNPGVWDDYYIMQSAQDTTLSDYVITKEAYNALIASKKNDYILGPSYRYTADTTKILGEETYSEGDVISNTTKEGESTIIAHLKSTRQDTTYLAGFENAYVAKNDVTIGSKTYTKGSCISKTSYDALSAGYKANFSEAYICEMTVQAGNDYYLVGDVITKETYNSLAQVGGVSYQSFFNTAWICTESGMWGGNVYKQNTNYTALDWASLSADDRNNNFVFNKDALDALSRNFLPKYSGPSHYLSEYDRNPSSNPIYSKVQTPGYNATYNGSGLYLGSISVTPVGKSSTSQLNNGDVLTSSDYSKLINEKAMYANIAVTGKQGEPNKNLPYHVVKTGFSVGSTIYTVGESFSDSVYIAKGLSSYSAKFDSLSLDGDPNTIQTVNYYWCTEGYNRPSTASGYISTYKSTNTKYYASNPVPQGALLTSNVYTRTSDPLVNQQDDFDITATIPDATSTLYVSKESQIAELRKDRIVTYDYVYSYKEAENDQGTSYANLSEHHIINVHIHFESGAPTIGVLMPPSIVMPGTKIGLNQPGVSKGAFEVLGGGWEMYATKEDAEAHTNPLTYVNNETPLHWYNDGYYVAYYAKSYLGKTFSNAVQLSVANYHRLDSVLNSTHTVTDTAGRTSLVHDYMYINNAAKEGIVRNSKIYINSAHELEGLYTLFNATVNDSTLTAVKGCQKLEFIIQDTINITDPWTPIGDATNCFQGNIHGDGYTISGLDNSLFGKLCGNVYNIGVTGSFTGAGIADAGDGNVTNAWVSSTAQPAAGMYPILGAGNGLAVNCYYPETMSYKDASAINGWTVSPKPAVAFLDGEVAYNLNGYYLGKRYAMGNSGTWPAGADKLYIDSVRFGSEDYVYSLGYIPTLSESRYDKSTGEYLPVYPDDYVFFGQKLDYGLVQGVVHQTEPCHVEKYNVVSGEYKLYRLTEDLDDDNRVLRAPAYYRSKEKQAAYFNRKANFIDKYGTAQTVVYDSLTAIDFSGHNDQAYTTSASQKQFYLPMLDIKYAGNIINDTVTGYVKEANISSINIKNLTPNLLVYGNSVGDSATYEVLENTLQEPYMDVSVDGYNTIDTVTDADLAYLYGHLVDRQADGSYIAASNHYLVDKEPFNCPIEYTFYMDAIDTMYMWYQRRPEVYSDGSKGWESICLPFSAHMVTTQDKGEITHFYGQSQKDHEYWLRGFCDMQEVPNDQNVAVPTAMFYRPQSLNDPGYNYRYEFAPASTPYVVNNTFLWDYYYQNGSSTKRADVNADTVQQGYYNQARSYKSYAYHTAEIPYIVSFPGETFYEFDLSGEYVAQYTSASIAKLDRQVVTFRSKAGQKIAVSDDEDRKSSFKCQGLTYTYEGTYLPDTLTTANYKLDATGARFDQLTAAETAVPFRAYYTLSRSANNAPQFIALSADLPYKDQKEIESEPVHGILVTVRNRYIVVQSALDYDLPVTIFNAAGLRVARFTVTPGAIISTAVSTPGVYLVAGYKAIVK